MGKTSVECGKFKEKFEPHKHEMAKGAAIGAAAIAGAKIGGGFGIVSGWLPGGATGAGVGAALGGGATALGLKSTTRCSHCEKVQIF